jgi:hypothetical protein
MRSREKNPASPNPLRVNKLYLLVCPPGQFFTTTTPYPLPPRREGARAW